MVTCFMPSVHRIRRCAREGDMSSWQFSLRATKFAPRDVSHCLSLWKFCGVAELDRAANGTCPYNMFEGPRRRQQHENHLELGFKRSN